MPRVKDSACKPAISNSPTNIDSLYQRLQFVGISKSNRFSLYVLTKLVNSVVCIFTVMFSVSFTSITVGSTL
jgi:hypothetical protein